jgi:predicted alpha/beta-hydrolase family hydrolase
MSAPTPRPVTVGALGDVTTLEYPSAQPSRAHLVLAHGAGTDQRHRVMAALARGIAAEGVAVTTFNFLYTEHGRRSPDRAPVLLETWRAVVLAVAGRLPPDVRLAVGGKSMGGRMASMLVAEPESSGPVARVSGLVLLGYPLHPPGKPEQLRTAHLPAVRVPMLLVQGTRDAFGTREEIEPVFRALPTRVDFEFIEGGDHSFAVPKSRGLAEADVLKAVCERVAGWLRG